MEIHITLKQEKDELDHVPDQAFCVIKHKAVSEVYTNIGLPEFFYYLGEPILPIPENELSEYYTPPDKKFIYKLNEETILLKRNEISENISRNEYMSCVTNSAKKMYRTISHTHYSLNDIGWKNYFEEKWKKLFTYLSNCSSASLC